MNALIPAPQVDLDMLRDTLGPGGLKFSDLDVLTVPSKGSTSWELPEGGGGSALEGVILAAQTRRTFYAVPYEEAEEGQKPDCSSSDGITGEGDPGGDCATCPLAQFGEDGERPRCSEERRLLFLKDGDALPVIVKVPGTGLAPFRKYCAQLVRVGKPLFGVRTRLTLRTDRKKNSRLEFTRIGFEHAGTIDDFETVKRVAVGLKQLISWEAS